MSSKFFLKGKSRKIHRKKDHVKTKKPKLNESNLKNGHESSDSDFDLKKFSDGEESESDHETAEQKKLRLAKKYLEEIKKEEANREELNKLNEDSIGKRLQNDYLEQKGKLKVQIADNFVIPTADCIRLICAKEHRLTLTCICVSSDGLLVFSGSKCCTIIKWGVKEKRKLGSITYKTHSKILKGSILSLTISTDTKYLASSDESNDIHIWDPSNLKLVHTFKGHKDIVTSIVFRKNTHNLYSSSKDRSVKTWSLDEMAYVETMFGHQSPIMSIDALTRERAVTAGGQDSSVRIWKIVEESQLIYNGPEGSLDEVKLLDEEHFVSGSDNGTICIWTIMKKKPLCLMPEAHGVENGVPRWITSLATLLNSDMFASGSYDGNIKLWKVNAYRSITPLFSISVNGFVNSMQFTSDGEQLYAAIGQEHKFGRWFKLGLAKNGLLIVNFNKKS